MQNTKHICNLYLRVGEKRLNSKLIVTSLSEKVKSKMVIAGY